MTNFVYRLSSSIEFVYRKTGISIHKRRCGLQNIHKLICGWYFLFQYPQSFFSSLLSLKRESYCET